MRPNRGQYKVLHAPHIVQTHTSIRFELHTWCSLKTLPSRASRAPRSSSRQSIFRRRGPGSCGPCSMARRSWPAGAKSASKKLPSLTTTGLETAVTAMGATPAERRVKRQCGGQTVWSQRVPLSCKAKCGFLPHFAHLFNPYRARMHSHRLVLVAAAS